MTIETKKRQNNLTMTSCQRIVTTLSFFGFLANSEQSKFLGTSYFIATTSERCLSHLDTNSDIFAMRYIGQSHIGIRWNVATTIQVGWLCLRTYETPEQHLK